MIVCLWSWSWLLWIDFLRRKRTVFLNYIFSTSLTSYIKCMRVGMHSYFFSFRYTSIYDSLTTEVAYFYLFYFYTSTNYQPKHINESISLISWLKMWKYLFYFIFRLAQRYKYKISILQSPNHICFIKFVSQITTWCV